MVERNLRMFEGTGIYMIPLRGHLDDVSLEMIFSLNLLLLC